MILEPRRVPLGGLRAIDVWRTLPHRDLPTIGAWCFVDHFGPTLDRMTVLPHPHTGLQTVTWPIAGDVRHRDSLGNDVVLRPTELNLMTSGAGISHSEFSVGDGDMHGIQLWLALPGSERAGVASFEHIDDLPRVFGDHWTGILLVGELAGGKSPAIVHSPVVGAEIRLDAAGPAVLPLDPGFEHGILAVTGDIGVDGDVLGHRHLQYVPQGASSLVIEADVPTTAFLIGGEPFTEPLVMWWNFIGRTHDEIVAAREDWEAQARRFGHVDGHDGMVIPAPPMPPLRLKPRVRRAL
jgi:redox-sensitive bicupin YhaK (pirin superfamily)